MYRDNNKYHIDSVFGGVETAVETQYFWLTILCLDGLDLAK